MHDWGFAIYSVAFLVIAVTVMVRETRNKRSDISEKNMLRVFFQWVFVFALYVAALFVALAALDAFLHVPFHASQAFFAKEFSLGLWGSAPSIAAPILAAATVGCVAACCDISKSVVLDLCFSSWIVYFVAVSIYTGGFPAVGGFWLSHCLSLVAFVLASAVTSFVMRSIDMPGQDNWAELKRFQSGVQIL